MTERERPRVNERERLKQIEKEREIYLKRESERERERGRERERERGRERDPWQRTAGSSPHSLNSVIEMEGRILHSYQMENYFNADGGRRLPGKTG